MQDTDNIIDHEAEQAVITKIEALFRQAQHPNTGDAERQAFQAKAIAMMQKYRIESIGDLDPEEEPTTYAFGTIRGSYASAHHQIVSAVARIYGCRTFYSSSGRAGDPTRHVYIVGFKADAARVKHLAQLFIDDAKAQAAKHKTNDPNTTIKWRKSFVFGYAAEVGRRYQESRKIVDIEANPAALVLVTREKQVEQKLKDLGLRKGAGSRGLDFSGYAAGSEAARNSNIGRARIGNSGTRALGR